MVARLLIRGSGFQRYEMRETVRQTVTERQTKFLFWFCHLLVMSL